jgi:hypothetical protein
MHCRKYVAWCQLVRILLLKWKYLHILLHGTIILRVMFHCFSDKTFNLIKVGHVTCQHGLHFSTKIIPRNEWFEEVALIDILSHKISNLRLCFHMRPVWMSLCQNLKKFRSKLFKDLESHLFHNLWVLIRRIFTRGILYPIGEGHDAFQQVLFSHALFCINYFQL